MNECNSIKMMIKSSIHGGCWKSFNVRFDALVLGWHLVGMLCFSSLRHKQTSLMCLIFLFQLMEVTGKNQDECMVALHDCNEDVSRAINFLLESTSDMVNKSFFHLVMRIHSFNIKINKSILNLSKVSVSQILKLRVMSIANVRTAH